MFSIIITIIHFTLSFYSLYEVKRTLKQVGSPLFQKTDIPERYIPFMRTDYKNWNKWEMYICSFTLFPIRILLSLCVLVSFIFTMLIATIGMKLKDPWPQNRFRIFRPLLQQLAKGYMLVNGFWFIKERTVKFEDFIPNYTKTYLSKGNPSIIISNHSSWYDTITYVYKYMPSFMSKDAVSRYPLFGWITTSLKSIYVKRDSEESRHQCVADLQQRVKFINEGKLFPPVIIFPEGTTTNGTSIIPFKRGAFDPLLPVKICCLKYSKRRFHPVLDVIGIKNLSLLALNQFMNEVEILEFEDLFDPTYLNLESYPQEKRWEIYAEACREVMGKALGFELKNANYRDGIEYQTQYVTGKMKQQ